MHNAVFFALAFLAGVVALQWLPELPNWPWLFFSIIAAIVLFCRPLRLPGLIILGFCWSGYFAQSQLMNRLPVSLEGVDLNVTGQVIGLPQTSGRSVRFLFQIKSTPSHPELVERVREVRLHWYQTSDMPSPGETWQMTVRLKRPHGFSNPFGFDYEGWLFRQGIDATGYVRNQPKPKRLAVSTNVCVDCLRQNIVDQLSELAPDVKHRETMLSLMIGDRRGITQEQWQTLQVTGTSHLFAISGLHIGLIAGLVYWLMRVMVRLLGRGQFRERQICLVGAITVAGLYALLAGFAVPAQRAWVMVTIAMIALVSLRHVRLSHGYGLALLAVLAMAPLVVHDVGFWLSFAAVGLLIWIGSGRLQSYRFIHGLLHAQWVLAIGLLPLLVWFFQTVPIWMPVANLIAVPWVSFVVVPLLMLVHVLIWLLPEWAVHVVNLADLSIEMLWQWLVYLEEVRLPEIPLTVASWQSYLLACVGVLWLLAPRGFPARQAAWLLFIPALFPLKPEINVGDFRLTLLDVGQGLSTVIETHQHVMVYDTGARWSDRFSAANSVLIPYLRGRGHDAIDTLVISHGDNDHAGGAGELHTSFHIERTLTSVPTQLTEPSAQSCFAGQTWVWDGVHFDMLHPENHDFVTGNNASCVLQITTGDKRVLLTGDIEQLVESRLVKQYGEVLASNVLIAPHHGSQSSSSQAFIDTVSPDVVLFPVGYRNRFGFPNQQVKQRYENAGIRTYDTATFGALSSIISAKIPIKVDSHRKSQPRYWHWTPTDSR